MRRLAVLVLSAGLCGCGSDLATPLPESFPAAFSPLPAAATNAYVHWGDSITCGNGASDAAHAYTGIMDAAVPGNSRTFCSAGALSIDLSPIVYATAGGLHAGDTAALLIGTNDVWVCGRRCLDNYTLALTGMAALLALPAADRIAAREMTQQGPWRVDDEIAGGLGLATSAGEASLSFAVTAPVAGRHLLLAWKGTDGSGARGTVRIDGAVAGTIRAAGSAPVLTPHRTRSAVFAAAFPLGSAGAHTVSVQYRGSGALTIEWAGVATQAAAAPGAPHLILGTVPREFRNFNDRTELFSDAVLQVAALLRGDGMLVEVADTHDALGAGDFSDGWVHPNDAGHARLAAAFLHPGVALTGP